MAAAVSQSLLADAPEGEVRTWRPLRFLAISRVALASLLVLLAQGGKPPAPLGSFLPELFETVALGYLAFSVITLFLGEQRIPRFQHQLYGQVFGDVVAITLLMHASGGVASGVGMLLVVSVANASTITAGRTAGLFAAVATIAILLQQTYMEFAVAGAHPNYPQAGLLGATLFATALLAHVLAQRAQESEARAARNELDLANMAQVTEFIIQHMQTGVMVIAPDQQVRFLNSAAEELLSLEPGGAGLTLRQLVPELADGLEAWHGGDETMSLLARPGGGDVLPRPLRVGPDGRSGTLIFLDDMTLASRQMQQSKLASLGRLTASIAHEIRNPLAAISHAGELLRESPALPASDGRLADIVVDQAQRVNRIIESVLRLGRKDRSRPTVLDLSRWLPQFVARFTEATATEPAAITLQMLSEHLACYFDENHLDQILTNLCENGLRHAGKAGNPRVEIQAGVVRKGRYYIDITDQGGGVPPDALPHIFEPFFTTGSKGTGLGLYIARELAECNRAQLAYVPTEDCKSRFRLSFSAPNETIGAV